MYKECLNEHLKMAHKNATIILNQVIRPGFENNQHNNDLSN